MFYTFRDTVNYIHSNLELFSAAQTSKTSSTLELIKTTSELNKLREQLIEAENNIDLNIKVSIQIYELMSQLVDDYWKDFPLEVRRKIEISTYELLQSENSIFLSQWSSKTLLADYKKSIRQYANSVFAAARLDEVTDIKYEDTKKAQSDETFSFSPFLKHMGHDREEQIQKNQEAIALLRLWLEEKIDPQNIQEERDAVEIFKKALDEDRPLGHKLFL